MDYKSKYLKYKEKYISLKHGLHDNHEGGGILDYKYVLFDFNKIKYALRTKNNLSIHEFFFIPLHI